MNYITHERSNAIPIAPGTDHHTIKTLLMEATAVLLLKRIHEYTTNPYNAVQKYTILLFLKLSFCMLRI